MLVCILATIAPTAQIKTAGFLESDYQAMLKANLNLSFAGYS